MNQKQDLSIFKVTEGNYFGDEGGFNQEVAPYSILVTTNCPKLFLIPKDVRHPEISEFLENNSEHWRRGAEPGETSAHSSDLPKKSLHAHVEKRVHEAVQSEPPQVR